MPKIEIDEDDYNRLTALRNVAGKIYSNPSSRKLLEQAQKLVEPNAATPTLDAEAQQLAPIKALEESLTKQINDLKQGQEERERQTRINEIASKQATDKAQLRKDGYTDEGLAAVEKIMTDKGLLDVMDAVAIFERNNPPQQVMTPGAGGSSWNFTDTTAEADKNIADLIATRGQNDQIADRMVREALSEFRGAIGRR